MVEGVVARPAPRPRRNPRPVTATGRRHPPGARHRSVDALAAHAYSWMCGPLHGSFRASPAAGAHSTAKRCLPCLGRPAIHSSPPPAGGWVRCSRSGGLPAPRTSGGWWSSSRRRTGTSCSPRPRSPRSGEGIRGRTSRSPSASGTRSSPGASRTRTRSWTAARSAPPGGTAGRTSGASRARSRRGSTTWRWCWIGRRGWRLRRGWRASRTGRGSTARGAASRSPCACRGTAPGTRSS